MPRQMKGAPPELLDFKFRPGEELSGNVGGSRGKNSRADSGRSKPARIDAHKANAYYRTQCEKIVDDVIASMDRLSVDQEACQMSTMRESPEYATMAVQARSPATRARMPRYSTARAAYASDGSIGTRRTMAPPSCEDLARVPGYTPTAERPDGLESFAKFESHRKRLSVMSVLSTTSSWCGEETNRKLASRAVTYAPAQEHRHLGSSTAPQMNLHTGKSSAVEKVKKILSKRT
ncbi:hypothetical protein EJ04DRAFT_525648 [Polyplosphaeria fusca]|uniref:Uncharacterized protein n=1 Tax=Polyplosphaeria fusca TaxID=682080 RepID=A0A9P4V0F3_9PLEO|nr:hypothetical protein EJ04DRAFT_525648 [Polyplosphaeria fusca]